MTQYILAASGWLNISAVIDYFRDVKRKYDLHKNIRHTIKELHALSDKELWDIGLTRGDIWNVAHEAYYDNRVQSNKNLKGWV